MSRSSWLDDEKTERRYSFPDGSASVITNEYQPIECDECGAVQYLRLTHIWHIDREGRCVPEYHVNRGADLDELKALLVSYADEAETIPVKEVRANGDWVLMVGDSKMATAE